MKISIGYKDIKGPWGGGISFSRQLTKFLETKNIEVISNLDDNDIDIILLTEPRRYTKSSSFTHLDIKNYILEKNSEVIVVNRINECDERKKTKGLNEFLINSSKVADHTIFISNWLKDLFIKQGFRNKNFSVIHNGADNEVFFKNENKESNKKLKIVTHHWGNNKQKGFEIYKILDELMEDDYFEENFEFIVIGNIPKKLVFKNTKLLEPMHSKDLAKYLRSCDIYITGSENEPAGMHHIEGAMSGLPILYLNSGGVTEYCEKYGLEYNRNNLKSKILEMKNELSIHKSSLNSYIYTGQAMVENYLKLFNLLLENKEKYFFNKKNLENIKLKNQYKIGSNYFYV